MDDDDDEHACQILASAKTHAINLTGDRFMDRVIVWHTKTTKHAHNQSPAKKGSRSAAGRGPRVRATDEAGVRQSDSSSEPGCHGPGDRFRGSGSRVRRPPVLPQAPASSHPGLAVQLRTLVPELRPCPQHHVLP